MDNVRDKFTSLAFLSISLGKDEGMCARCLCSKPCSQLIKQMVKSENGYKPG